MIPIVVSVSGASDDEIHGVVEEEVNDYGYRLGPLEHELGPDFNEFMVRYGNNYVQMRSFRIAEQGPLSALAMKNAIEKLLDSDPMKRREKSNLSLLLVGKSAGSILIWNAMRLHYDFINDFHRVAAVLIDPHGAALGDGEFGSYNVDQDLWWPNNWSSDHDFFRVYHVYQKLHPGAGGGLTGANFPDTRVYRSVQLTDPGTDHTNIPKHTTSRGMIRDALNFVCLHRGETVSKPLSIVIENGRGSARSIVDGNEEFAFHLENLKCSCYDASVQIDDGAGNVHTWRKVKENEILRHRSRKPLININADCGTKSAYKQVHLDFEPPTFELAVDTHEKSATLFAINIQDDWPWNPADYHVQVVLEPSSDLETPKIYSGNGTRITLNNLSYGKHLAKMKIKDAFGRESDTKSIIFWVRPGEPKIDFIEPRENFPIYYASSLNVVVDVNSPNGFRSIKIYLDQIDDEFFPTCICSKYDDAEEGHRLGEGHTERVSFPPVSVTSYGHLNWNPGMHKLIAIAKDYSGKVTRVERAMSVTPALTFDFH